MNGWFETARGFLECPEFRQINAPSNAIGGLMIFVEPEFVLIFKEAEILSGRGIGSLCFSSDWNWESWSLLLDVSLLKILRYCRIP